MGTLPNAINVTSQQEAGPKTTEYVRQVMRRTLWATPRNATMPCTTREADPAEPLRLHLHAKQALGVCPQVTIGLGLLADACLLACGRHQTRRERNHSRLALHPT